MNDDGYTPRETKLRQILLRHENRPNYMLAAQASLSPSRLSEYAWGRRPIPPKHLVRLCDVLHCSPDDIVGYAEPLEDER